jgi:hypothetical protein
LAAPSFHDGNGPLEAVWADVETVKGGADRAGSNANAVTRVRRSMPERRIVSFMFGYSYLKLKDGRIIEEIGLDDGVAALTFRPVKTAAYIGRESLAL